MDIRGRALLSTSRFVYLVDLATGDATIIASGQGLYYGITWDHNHTYIVCADFHPFLRKLTRPKVLVFDRFLRKIAETRPPFKIRGGVHQAYYDPFSDSMWWMSSKDDAALILHNSDWEKWSPVGETLREWRARLGAKAKKNWDQPDSDIHHLNSVWMKDGKIFFVAHNWGPSEVYIFEQKTRKLLDLVPIGTCAHNVWTEGDDLFVCCSSEGTILNHRGEVKIKIDGFIRGVAATEQFRIVGISEKADRRNRARTAGHIKVLTHDWKPVCCWSFKNAGQVLEVRILSEGDLCHNGMPAPIDNSVLEGAVSQFSYAK